MVFCSCEWKFCLREGLATGYPGSLFFVEKRDPGNEVNGLDFLFPGYTTPVQQGCKLMTVKFRSLMS